MGFFVSKIYHYHIRLLSCNFNTSTSELGELLECMCCWNLHPAPHPRLLYYYRYFFMVPPGQEKSTLRY